MTASDLASTQPVAPVLPDSVAAPVNSSVPGATQWVVSVLAAHGKPTDDPVMSLLFTDEREAGAAAQRLLRAADRMRASGGVFRDIVVHLSKAQPTGTVEDEQSAEVLLREALGLPPRADRSDETAVEQEKAERLAEPWRALLNRLAAIDSPSKSDFDALYAEAVVQIRRAPGAGLPDQAHEFTAAMYAKGWQP